MGELLLCSRELASLPYYIETVSWHVYSLEELCYYIRYNTDLLEPSFMDEELCGWIRMELKMPLLADRLMKVIKEGGSLAVFVETLAEGCSYLGDGELSRIKEELRTFENKSDVECAKIRADRLLEKKKYSVCILAYRRLLHHPDVSGWIEGNIWHNMGTACAGLFLFQEAARCYELAYEKNQNPASKQQQNEALKLAAENNQMGQEKINPVAEETGDLLQELKDCKEQYLRSVR